MELEKKPYTRIVVDVDGVLANITTAFIKHFDMPYTEDDITDYEMLARCCGGKETMWDMLDDPSFHDLIEPYPWANQIMELATEYSREIPIIATAAIFRDREKWLERYFPNFPNSFGRHKFLLIKGRTLLIDDYTKYCDKFASKGGEALLFPRPWNCRYENIWKNPMEHTRETLIKLNERVY